MNIKIITRLIVNIVIFLAILNGWWFVALPLGIIGVWSFSYFIEIIIAGIGFDSLFGFLPEMGIWGYVGTIVSIFFYLASNFLKGRVR